MHKFTKNSFIDFDEYESHLRYLGHIYLDDNLLINAYNETLDYWLAYEAMTERYMNVMSGRTYQSLRNERIMNYLIEFENCPSWRFKSDKNISGVSVNRKTVLEPLYNEGYATQFLDLYLTFSSYKKLNSSLNLLEQKHSKTIKEKGTYGEVLNQCNFSVSQRQNYRYNYSKHDIITIPKQYSSAVTVPKGKVLAWGDFSQADLRAAYNIFIRDSKNIEVVKQYSDMYEAIARIVKGDDFDIDEFKSKRDLMKAVILSCVYGKRTDIEKSKADFLREFGEYLDTKCPRYIEYRNRIAKHKSFKKNIVLDTYFGPSVIVDKGWGTDMSTEHKCLNYPIQSCTSLLVILTVNAILNQFYSLGYTEDQIGLYYTRHDEPIFIMDKEVMKDSWVFKDYDKIFIDDWYPMELKFNFGYNYTIPDQPLNQMYEESINQNKNRLHFEEMDEISGEEFLPLKSIYELKIGTCYAYDNSVIVAIYDDKNKECQYLKLKEFNFEAIEAAIYSNESNISKNDYSGVIISNRYTRKEVFYTEIAFVFNSDLEGLTFADNLAEYMAYKFAKRDEVESGVSQTCIDNIEQIKGVKTVEKLLSNS